MRKLMYRVVFPMELKLCNTTDDAPSCDDVYNLVAVVVHSGSSINHGHYVSLVKSHGHWLLFDDDHVETIPDSWVERTFGTPSNSFSKITDRGYILFYEKSSKREIPDLSSTTMNTLMAESFTNMADLNGMKSHSGSKMANKTAGVAETSVSRSNTVPNFDSKTTGTTATMDSLTRAASDRLSGLESSSSMPTAKKQNRSSMLSTFKSYLSGSKTSVLSANELEERGGGGGGGGTVSSNLSRSLADEYHVQNAKTNPVQSPGV